MLPPVPPLQQLTTRSAPSTPAKVRTLATTASRKQPAPKADPEHDPKSDEHVLSTGPKIESQRSEALKPEPVAPERVGAAPGLPATAAKSAGGGLNMQMPGAPATQEVDPIIVRFFSCDHDPSDM